MNDTISFTLMGKQIEIRADVVSVSKSQNSITIEYEDGSFNKWMGFGAKLDILEIIAHVARMSYCFGKHTVMMKELRDLSDINERLKNENHNIKLQYNETNYLLNSIEEKLGLG